MSFEQVWSPKYETSLNVVGNPVERGARAILKQEALIKQAGVSESFPSISERNAAFEEVYSNPGPQFKRLAFTLQTPIKDRNDYVAVGRKLLLTDELPVGEIPAYDLDIPEFGAVVVGARSAAPVVSANVQRVIVPTFSIHVTTAVDYEDITIRRYPVFDRAKERTAIASAITEDTQIFSLLKQASAVSPQGVTPKTTGSFERSDAARMLGKMLSYQLAPGAYTMHPMRYSDILTWGQNDLDQVSLNVIVETGQFGVLHGVRLITSTRMDPRYIYLATTPDKLGRIPERKSIEVKVVDWPKDKCYYITSWEQLGFTVLNTAGLVTLNLTDSNLPMPAKYPLS